MADIGIVIVTYNSGEVIGACLDAIVPTGAEIVVVDNASTDSTRAEVERRGVRIIPNAENRGFAGATNQGFAVLHSPYVLMLNPDAVLIRGLERLRKTCDLPGAAGAGGKLVDTEGRAQVGFMVRGFPTAASLALESLLLNRLWPNNPVNRRYRGLDLNYDSRQEVDQPAGAFLMIRRAVWQELGGLDEGYFPLWFEDVDFCRRAAERGYRLYYEPEAVAKHTGSHSIPQLGVELRAVYWYRSLLRYSAGHFRPWAYRAVCLAVLLGSFPRLVTELARDRSLKPMAAYGEVVRLASRYFFSGWRGGAVLSGPRITL